MNKNTMTISDTLLGRLSKVFVTEQLGINPEQHQLTSEGTWIRLAERLLQTSRIEKRSAGDSRPRVVQKANMRRYL